MSIWQVGSRTRLTLAAVLPITLIATGTLATSALAVAPPASQQATASAQSGTSASLARALPNAKGIPAIYRAMDDDGPIAGDTPNAPDICPVTRSSEAPETNVWATNTMPTRTNIEYDNVGDLIEASAWRYRGASAAGVLTLVQRAGLCSTRAVVNENGTVTQIAAASARIRPATAVSTVIAASNTAPRVTVLIQAWSARGNNLGGATIEHIGYRPGPLALSRDRANAARIAETIAVRAAYSAQSAADTQSTESNSLAASETGGAVQQSNPSGPWAVSIGDSYISGEAGRWDGNVLAPALQPEVDRGRNSYWDNANKTGEKIPLCHRSKSAEIHIGGNVNSLNLACSGATTLSASSKGAWKPGIDFSLEPGGDGEGQAKMLQDFAASHDVKMVVMSIGGNNFHFSKIIEGCVKKFLLSASFWKRYCSTDSDITKYVSDNAAKNVKNQIKQSIANVRKAMQDAGKSESNWKLVVQNYPAPIPGSSRFRYWQTQMRMAKGGCGFWNKDADWAVGTVLPQVNNTVAAAIKESGATNILSLDLTKAMDGHRLCEEGADNFYKQRTPAQKVKDGEWVQQINTLSAARPDLYVQESLHPNWWGQLAVRNCLRQVWLQSRGGKCERINDSLTQRDEPNMKLQ